MITKLIALLRGAYVPVRSVETVVTKENELIVFDADHFSVRNEGTLAVTFGAVTLEPGDQYHTPDMGMFKRYMYERTFIFQPAEELASETPVRRVIIEQFRGGTLAFNNQTDAQYCTQ